MSKLLPLPYPEVFRILCQHGSIVMPSGTQFPFSRKVLDKAGHVVGWITSWQFYHMTHVLAEQVILPPRPQDKGKRSFGLALLIYDPWEDRYD